MLRLSTMSQIVGTTTTTTRLVIVDFFQKLNSRSRIVVDAQNLDYN
jgi:hypothetical protein